MVDSSGEAVLLAVMGELGKELELEKLSSNLDSERQVETDLAEPELTEPVPVKRELHDLDWFFSACCHRSSRRSP